MLSVGYGSMTGKIVGKITDENGGALQGVNVFLAGEELGASSDALGNFVILNVLPGVYTLKVNFIGYKVVTVNEVVVSIGLTTIVDVQLELDVLKGEEVTVVAERRLLKPDDFTSRHSVTADEIEIQPIDNFIEIAQNQAGVVGSHFRGGRSSEVLVVIDGIPMRDPAGEYSGNIGSFTGNIPEQSIQELEVTLGGFSAEYGNVQSGVLNVVTKEGQDNFSGSFKVTTTDAGAKLNDILMGERDTWGGTFNRYRNEDSVLVDTLMYGNKYQHKLMDVYQFSLSGPLPFSTNFSFSAEITDRSQGYFLNEQYFNQTYQGKINLKFSPKLKLAIGGLYSASAWDEFYFPASKYGPAPDYPVNEYLYVDDGTLYSYQYVDNPDEYEQGVVDYQAGLLDSTAYDSSITYYIAGMQEYLWNRSKTNQSIYAIFSHNLTARTFYELRIQSARTNYHYSTVDVDDRDGDNDTGEDLVWDYDPDDPNDNDDAHPIYRERIDNYWWSRGDDPGYRDQTSWSNTIHGDITSQVTINHMLKGGFQLGLHRTKVENISWTLALGTFRKDIWDENTIDFGVFLQDKMEFRGLTALVGLRWDYFDPNGWGDPIYYPSEFEYPYVSKDSSGIPVLEDPISPDPKMQFSPRIGISHPITDRDVLHFTYGHYFQRPDAYYLYRNHYYQSLTKVGNYVGNPDLMPEKTVSYDFGIEHLFTNDIKVSVTGYYKDISNLMDWYKYIGRSLQGTELNIFTNVDYGNVKGLEFTFIKRAGNLWGGSINYTYSIARGRSSSSGEGAGTFSSEKRMVLLDFDQTHTVNANLTLVTPNKIFRPLADWRANFQFKAGSGLPYTSYDSDVVNDSRLPATYNVDLRLNKKILLRGTLEMDLFMDVYNLFNRENIDWIGDATHYHETGDYSVIRYRTDTGELVRNPQTLSEERQFRFGIAIKF